MNERKTTSGIAELPPDLLSRMADALKILAHPQRLRIIEALDRHGDLPVHRIVEIIGIRQASVSDHLGRMRRAGLIASERKGRETWYRIADPDSLIILNCMRKRAASLEGTT
jgi:ArsR family transcriptional regulator